MDKFIELEKQLKEELDRIGSKSVNGDMITYRTILHEGGLGDMATEWWTQEDWDEYSKFIKKLKARGTYGKPYICEITLKHIPEYDVPQNPEFKKSLESYSFVMLDFSK